MTATGIGAGFGVMHALESYAAGSNSGSDVSVLTRLRGHDGRRLRLPPAPRLLCVSACKIGSDSFLMMFRIVLA
ncbi:hypothetical protein [Rhizobium sp. RU36D]|uniref:hypothetical protein n=1 Tax=Rhizobium sp. RU36D TaxID=1907415 RepID=UPI000A0530C5|nr:hypothetical protein [Rhizobium sp. RU36D]